MSRIMIPLHRYGHYSVGILFCVWSMFLLDNAAAVDQIQAIEYPVDTSVIEGEIVTFTCTVEEPANDNQILDWFIEWDNDTITLRKIGAQTSIAISATDRPEFSGRGTYITSYSMTVAADGTKTHTCKLIIISSTSRDNGFYGCTHQIRPEDTHRTLLEEKIRLTVVPVPTLDPECTLIVSQQIFILTCVPLGGTSDTQITWYEGQQMRGESRTVINTIEIPGAEVTARRVFVCLAQQGSQSPKTCSITVNPIIIPTISRTTAPTNTNASTSVIPTTREITERSTSVNPTTREITELLSLQTTTVRQTSAVPRGGDDNSGAIVGAVLSTLLLLILVLLLLLFLFCRKRRQKKEPEIVVEMAPPPPTELPTLEPAPQTAEENPYGSNVVGGAQGQTVTQFDDELEKPWKKDPSLLMGVENNGFSDIELSDADSATESFEATNAIDDQPYENYTVS